jgi:hypothetical protein
LASILFNVGGYHITEMVAQLLKQAEKLTLLPERVVHATGGRDAAGVAAAGVASAAWLKVVVVQLLVSPRG